MGLIEDRAAAQGMRMVPLTPTLDVSQAAPEVATALLGRTPALADPLGSLRQQVPVPRTSTIEGERAFYRPANHNRSFCFSVSEAEEYRSPTVVFKGLEPLCDDFSSLLDWMTLSPFRRSSLVMADHFPLKEGKIPGTLSLHEARGEFQIAAELQAKHLRAFGELARLPVPLFVYRFSGSEVQRARTLLGQKLSPAAWSRVEPVFDAGIGAYVYAYWTGPIRANVFAGPTGPKLRKFVESTRAPDATVRGWIQLMARLLLLGYLPFTPRNAGLGACMDYGNATLDGGFCDLDSIEPFGPSTDTEFVLESVAQSLEELVDTVAVYLSAGEADFKPDLYGHHEKFLVRRFVCKELERALQTEHRSGLSLDPRVTQLLSPGSIAELSKLLQRAPRPYAYASFLRHGARRG